MHDARYEIPDTRLQIPDTFKATRNRVAVAAKVLQMCPDRTHRPQPLFSSRKASWKLASSQIHMCCVTRRAAHPASFDAFFHYFSYSVSMQPRASEQRRPSRCCQGADRGSPTAFARSRLQPTRAGSGIVHAVAVALRGRVAVAHTAHGHAAASTLAVWGRIRLLTAVSVAAAVPPCPAPVSKHDCGIQSDIGRAKSPLRSRAAREIASPKKYMHLVVAALALLHDPSTRPSRRAALGAASTALGVHPLLSSAAAPIQQGAPAFGTKESRTGLLDGIKSAFSEKSGDDLAREYALSPVDISGVSLPPRFSSASDVAIIFHGSGGPDRETSDVLTRFQQQDAVAGLDREVVVFNWMRWFTSNTDRLSFQSASVGSSLGAALASNRGLRSLHIVGTSAGSFAADACCSAYVAAAGGTADAGDRAAVRLTLADPFAARDGTSFQVGRGAQFFGKDADFAEHYLNTCGARG